MADLDRDPADGHPGPSALDDYRRTVARLREETEAEIGPQPMAPEMASMIAIAAASLPIVALMLPGIPLDLQVWHVGLILGAVWGSVFRCQRLSYDRFEACWRAKVVAYQAAEPAPMGSRLLRGREVTAAGRDRRPAPAPR